MRLYIQMEMEYEHLVAGCRHGERGAQLRLYEIYARRLYVTCLRIIGDSAEAEEAMQDSFLKILTHIDSYNESQRLEAWMRRIAIHTAIDYVRRENPDMVEIDDNMAIEEEEELNEDEIEYSVELVKRGMKELPTGYRVIISLYLFEGYDMEEISSILKIKPASVRSQYLRAKRKLLDIITSY